ncbi:MAG: FAD-dependent oxidoreductase [Phycisphaerales bacterium]|nr:FAD-dependent oxidoreductase [Phycisphaerales bacterium]
MGSARMVVVGAGIVGLCTAYELATRGQRVTVLDRERLGESASCGNAGLFSIGHYPLTRPGASWRGFKWMFDPQSPLWIRPTLSPALLRWLWMFHRSCDAATTQQSMRTLCALGWRTIQALEKILDEESIACHYQRSGWLDIVCDDRALDAAEAEGRSLAPFGYRTRRLSGDELRAWDGSYTDAVAGAVHYEDTAIIHPGLLMQGLAQAVVRRGGEIRTDAAVTALVCDHAQRCAGVRLASGEVVEGETVVLAAGIWSEQLARTVGVRVPMQPARGYHIQLEGMARLPKTGGVLHETAVAYTPMGNQLRLAGTLEIAPLGRPWMRRRLEALTRQAARAIHGISQTKAVEEWAGYRPCTADGMPIIGFSREIANLYIATGHAMMGLMLGPVTGMIAAADILGLRQSVSHELLASVRPRRL